MAQQIYRPPVIGNFKPTLTQREKAKRDKPKAKRARREGNSDAHKAAICKLPCCVPGCTVVGCDPHHLKHGPAARERSVLQKATDRWLVPICRHHHIFDLEVRAPNAKLEPGWFKEKGIGDPIELAAALYAASPDAGKMTRIVLAYKGIEVRK
jgi:hypothetical protein